MEIKHLCLRFLSPLPLNIVRTDGRHLGSREADSLLELGRQDIYQAKPLGSIPTDRTGGAELGRGAMPLRVAWWQPQINQGPWSSDGRSCPKSDTAGQALLSLPGPASGCGSPQGGINPGQAGSVAWRPAACSPPHQDSQLFIEGASGQQMPVSAQGVMGLALE